MLRKISMTLIAVLGLSSAALAQQDKELIQSARDTMKKNEKAIITLKATVEIAMQGELAAMMPNGGKQENKVECLGTIIDPSGMAVCSLAQLDPSSVVSSINVRGKTMTVSGTVTDLKYRLADGTEVPARLLLKDDSLDIAFVAPETTPAPDVSSKFTAISLDSAADSANLLDEVVYLSRTGKSLNYTSTVLISQVTGQLTNPRVEYLVPSSSLGVPGFDRTGKLIGMCLMHHSGSSEVNADSGRAQREATPVLLPASEIVNLLPQAREELAKPVKKTEKKPTTAPTTAPTATE